MVIEDIIQICRVPPGYSQPSGKDIGGSIRDYATTAIFYYEKRV